RDLMTPDEVGRMRRDECLVRIAGVPVFRSKKYLPTRHKNWKLLAEKETDDRWCHYHINPLSHDEPLDLFDHKMRDLTAETTLH
ncbi:TPA: type IV secretory system conjugative DNA transfer family protein, partial [Streptococcus agalactiae]